MSKLYTYNGSSWVEIGVNGINGDDGREVELNKSSTHIQWRYVGDVSWTDLLPLSDIKGDQGDPATNLVTSVNGRQGVVTGLAEQSDLTAHTSNTSNPHSVTKAQVGLGNADNTSDLNKPISTATKAALDAKQAAGSYAPALGADDNYVTDAEKTKLSNLSGTNTGDNAANTTSNAYADGKVADAINDGVTTIAPSQNAVYDALALKANDSAVVHNSGDETVGGNKTFSGYTCNTGGMGMNNTVIDTLGTPTASDHASTKGYVDVSMSNVTNMALAYAIALG